MENLFPIDGWMDLSDQEDIRCPYCRQEKGRIEYDWAVRAKAHCLSCGKWFLLQWNSDRLEWELQQPYETYDLEEAFIGFIIKNSRGNVEWNT